MPLELIQKSRLVAIIRLERLDHAQELVHVLLEAGVRCLEFTLTNPDAPRWIHRLLTEDKRFENGDACIGVGSVRNVDEARLVLDAGAQFVVTPITSVKVIEVCVERKVPIASGAFTPTEIATAWDAGANIVKVFPARVLGPGYIRDVLAPLPYIQLMPTGGIDTTNAGDYLSAGAIAVGVGGQLCPVKLVENKDWDTILHSAKRIVDACA
ncbi:MAG: bifunctional 4-hydroxy-2-oxoglutarate aldolase/2-dehydro-3-deoxy-phosphogluconate aldolase [Planctomycetes bacterium]|nr:bifunctional 4-hydroxy-2-oxoglutarate aldolase/2-dehydro-3-deoxy-phosphogluconate aldolase [Planctomycetota bacterium]